MAKLDQEWTWCTITNFEKPSEKVEACFNPSQISIDKKVPWNKHKKSKGDSPELEFTNGEPETLSVELFFDGYEEKIDVYETYIKSLRAMTLIDTDKSGKDKRPPRVLLTWGNKKFLGEVDGSAGFKGVITSLATKYKMFLPDGTPVRATCTVSLQQADKVKAKVEKKKKKANKAGSGAPAAP